MNHDEFVREYKAERIAVRVDKNRAGFMYGKPGLMPQSLRAQQAMLRTIAFGVLLLGIAMFFFSAWWLALVVVIVGFFLFPKAQNAAAKGVLEASLQDSGVYREAVENQVLVVERK